LQLQEAVDCLQAGFNQPPRDRDALKDDGIRVKAIHHPCPALVFQPQPYDDNNSDEHIDEVFGRNYGVARGGGGCRGARGGIGYKGYECRNVVVGHGEAYGEYPRHQEPQEYQMKIDLPSFDGHLHIEDFLDWITEVEQFFDYMNIPQERKVKLVGGTSAWWEQLQLSRGRKGKRLVTSWFKMKRLLNARFLPPDFEQRLFQ
jgi:hypothetical protein